LISIAARGPTPPLRSLENAASAPLDVLRLFRASLEGISLHDTPSAVPAGVDADAFDAVLRLLCVPCLMTVMRRSTVDEHWSDAYCPICGAWPAFVEVRGIERRRLSRCQRCGSQWHARHLRCTFCSNTNHEELAALVPSDSTGRGTVEACLLCRGYIKTLTTLQGCRADAVIVEDFASVDLDIAAVQQGYTRPVGLGSSLALHIHADT
jgi:FdhE protein